MLVVDASAATYLAARRRGFAGLGDLELVAPSLMWSESLSALREALWRGELSHELAEAARDRLIAAPVRRRQPAALHRLAWAIAEELGWAKTYDAEYVALARILDCRLLTRDQRLRRGAARAVDVIGPNEL